MAAARNGGGWRTGASCGRLMPAAQSRMSTFMNHRASPMTTTAAEGMPRRAFTVAELEQMTAAGILKEDERIELIGGDIVPMSPKGNHHEVLKTALNMYWIPRVPLDLLLTTETTFYLTEDTYLEPDFIFYPKVVGHRGLNAATAKL